MSIFINVVGQRMYISSSVDGFVAGSQNFVKFQFNLSEEWNGLSTFAQFRQGRNAYNCYLDEQNSVYLPSEIKEGLCTLMLYGSQDETIGTSNYIELKIAKCMLANNGVDSGSGGSAGEDNEQGSSGSVTVTGAVAYDTVQSLSASQRTTAKNNIGVYVSADEPADAQDGDIWFDTDETDDGDGTEEIPVAVQAEVVGYVDFDQNVRSVNHRGYSTTAPENTLPAYQLSRKMGFTYVEADVSFTSDGIAVLLHDSTIDRTSDGSGSISSMTYDEASQYDYGCWKSDDYAGTRIPTFEEFLKLCKNLCLHPYIELKSNGAYTEAQIKSLVTTVKKYGMRGKVTWISFSSAFLDYVKSADPTARLGYLVTSVTSDIITTAQGLKTDNNEVFIDSSDYDTDAIELCCDADIPLEVWTINNVSVIRSIDPYITGVTSDYLLAGKILFNESQEPNITDVIVDINMDDNGLNVTGDSNYNATVSNGGTFEGVAENGIYGHGKFVVNGSGALTIPTDFMNGTEPWTIAFTIDSYTIDSTNTYCRVARGSRDVPSIFAIGSTEKFMFKMASTTIFENNVVWYDSDFLTPADGIGTNSALTFVPPTNEKTTYVFCNDGTYITFWVNGAMKAKQEANAYTPTYYSSTFSIGDNAAVGFDMASMKCSMLKAWRRALSAEEIAIL